MASGSERTVPNSTADVFPAGLGLDFIPADQIAYALQSSLLHDAPVGEVPEPASMALAGADLFAIVLMRRRRTA